jgi:EAL domain-containing protein (putative c-di-GMP-specific phosphodiesterase class I)/ActR/RegA family two-component response regulator
MALPVVKTLISNENSATPLMLVIDDDPFFCAQIQLFARSHFLVLEYSSPGEVEAEALDRADLIVLDLLMPEQDGIEFLRNLALIYPQKPVLIVSGSDDRIIRMASRAAEMFGMTHVQSLQKPVQYGVFRGALSRMLSLADNDEGATTSVSGRRPAFWDGQLEADHNNSLPRYQPQIDIKTFDVVGLHVSTSLKNLPVGNRKIAKGDSARDSGQDELRDLSLALLETAMLEYKANTGRFVGNCRLSVSLSADLLINDTFINDLTAIIWRLEFPASQFALSFNNPGLRDINKEIYAGLARLKLKGFRLSLKNLGATLAADLGAISEIYDELVIDPRLVRELTISLSSRAIIESILLLNTRSKIRIIADGVDDERTLSWLRQLGEPIVQGRLFSCPLRADELPGWLKQWKP